MGSTTVGSCSRTSRSVEGATDLGSDLVLIHHTFGVVDIEVKGHHPEIRDGVWYAHGAPMTTQPIAQARTNAYELRVCSARPAP